jgi:hypothetical protein
MKFAREILGLLLIAILAMATSATGYLTAADHASGSSVELLSAPGERPASCHAHGRMSLSDSQLPHSPVSHSSVPLSSPPAPVRYECCLTGHDVAVVQAPHYTSPSHQWTRVTMQIPPLTEYIFSGSEVSMLVSADPPGTTPLRI